MWVLAELRSLPEAATGGQAVERIHAALVLGTHGDWSSVQGRLRLASLDWRDLLVGAGLGHDNWPVLLDEALGTGSE